MSEAAGLMFFIRPIKRLPFLGEVSRCSLSKPLHQNQKSSKAPNVAKKIESFRLWKSGFSSNKDLMLYEGLQQRLAV